MHTSNIMNGTAAIYTTTLTILLLRRLLLILLLLPVFVPTPMNSNYYVVLKAPPGMQVCRS